MTIETILTNKNPFKIEKMLRKEESFMWEWRKISKIPAMWDTNGAAKDVEKEI